MDTQGKMISQSILRQIFFSMISRYARSAYVSTQDIPIGHALLVAHRSTLKAADFPEDVGAS